MVLLYHSIGNSPWALSLDGFRAQVEWLAEQAKMLPLEGLLSKEQSSGLEVTITFDDGYSSLMKAADVLGAHGAVATIYLNTGWIDAELPRESDASVGHYPGESFLTWQQVEKLRDAGWTIGSHGVEHLDLTCQAPSVVKRELSASRQRIEQRLRQPCRHFSYTWGRHNTELIEAVCSAGYNSAVSTLHGPVSSNSSPYAIPRINIHRDYSLNDFMAAVTGAWDFLAWVQRVRST